MGHEKAVVLTMAIHNPFEHVPVGLLLASVRGSPQDSTFKFDQWLGLPPKGYKTFHKVTSIVLLLPNVNKQMGFSSAPQLTID